VKHDSEQSSPPDFHLNLCRLCGAISHRIGGFCSRDCEEDWRDGMRAEDVFEILMARGKDQSK